MRHVRLPLLKGEVRMFSIEMVPQCVHRGYRFGHRAVGNGTGEIFKSDGVLLGPVIAERAQRREYLGRGTTVRLAWKLPRVVLEMDVCRELVRRIEGLVASCLLAFVQRPVCRHKLAWPRPRQMAIEVTTLMEPLQATVFAVWALDGSDSTLVQCRRVGAAIVNAPRP